MDHDLLLLIAQANIAVSKAIRQRRFDEADRWSRLMERYARSLNAIRRYREYEISRAEAKAWKR